MVCGVCGRTSAVKAGCLNAKIYNFPYVVNKQRIKKDIPNIIPPQLLKDVTSDKFIITFSGRMIERKGLMTLLESIILLNIKLKKKFILWIEGDGPLIDKYKSFCIANLISIEYRFLGFCQYKLHSWILKNSDCVVIPSLEDNWGIVVDEAQQLGKLVLASTAVGSAIDRIDSGENGYLFSPGDKFSLSLLINNILSDESSFSLVRRKAEKNLKTITPDDNVNTISKIFHSI